MSIEENKKNIQIIRRANEAYNTGDTSKVHEFISPEYFNHESQSDPQRATLRGPEEFINTLITLRNAFPDLYYKEHDIISSGDKVVTALTVSGKHTGSLFGMPPTGKSFSYEAIHIFRIGTDDKIVEHRAVRDDLSFMLKLGLVSPSSNEYEQFFQAWKDYKN